MNFLTVKEFAEKTKMHPASVRRAIRNGKIYAFRPGMGVKSSYRIAESELERLQLHGMYEISESKKS
jgi:excisionase family DNA binding protein